MFDKLQALAIGIISFAIIIGIGSIVLHEFGGSVAICPDHSVGNSTVWNSTTNTCGVIHGGVQNGSFVDPLDQGAFKNVDYLNTELGTSGLAGWTPAIVAISVGMLFMGIFLFRGSKTY